jgi:hypothetical protein
VFPTSKMTSMTQWCLYTYSRVPVNPPPATLYCDVATRLILLVPYLLGMTMINAQRVACCRRILLKTHIHRRHAVYKVLRVLGEKEERGRTPWCFSG